MKKRRRADGPSCPIRSRMYGGIPGGGGFGSTTEWEIGAQRAASAAHCILGSLGKQVYGREFDWVKTLRVEHGHIDEELGIIQHVMREYARPLYTDRLRDGYYDEADVRKTVQSVRSAGPRLMETAEEMLDWWKQQRDVPPAIHQLGVDTYRFLTTLGATMNGAIGSWPEQPIQNPYRDPQLIRAAKRLGWAVDGAYADAPPVKVTPWPSPQPAPQRPLTEEEKQQLKQQPGESNVDHIMRLLGAETAGDRFMNRLFRYKGYLYREAGPVVREADLLSPGMKKVLETILLAMMSGAKGADPGRDGRSIKALERRGLIALLPVLHRYKRFHQRVPREHRLYYAPNLRKSQQALYDYYARVESVLRRDERTFMQELAQDLGLRQVV